jgi:hypothetical protein
MFLFFNKVIDGRPIMEDRGRDMRVVFRCEVSIESDARFVPLSRVESGDGVALGMKRDRGGDITRW